jgi:hypothetical protein
MYEFNRTFREGEEKSIPPRPSAVRSAPLTELNGLAGDGRPFSLFFPNDAAMAMGLEYAAASLLGAGVS